MPSSFESWNRKIHIYVGLYFLFFLWLFCLSGLFLNHPTWQFTAFWEKRIQTSFERPLAGSAGGDDIQMARAVMADLGIRGEVSGKIDHPAAGESAFRVVKPGDIYEIKVNRTTGIAMASRIHLNGWGVMNMLHSFTGVRRSDPELHQNWWVTGIWRLSMDALSAGMIFMVLTGIVIWFRQAQRRVGGMLALIIGIITIAIFLL